MDPAGSRSKSYFINMLRGGGGSLERTRLRYEFPGNSEKYREFCDIVALSSKYGPKMVAIGRSYAQIP